ncbi:MAG: hypothetical protein JXA68_05770 [Ignavibacteriales bacterium]|nr:hypothetical protein [Ignavibacteriales bacterium]
MNSFAQTDPLTFEEKAKIKKCGLILEIDDHIRYDTDIQHPRYSLMGPLQAATYAANFEKAISAIITKYINGWNFIPVFRNTFYEIFKEVPFEIDILNDTITRKQIRKNRNEYLSMGLNTIIDIKVSSYGIHEIRFYGIQAFKHNLCFKDNLCTIYIRLKIIVEDLTTKTIIAEEYIEYNYNYAQENYTKDIEWYKISEEYKNTGIPPDSLITFPIVKKDFYSFINNNGQMLKRELKIAALETCREIYSFLFLSNCRKKEWFNDYRLVPSRN